MKEFGEPAVAKTESTDLEFPDWSGMIHPPNRMTAEAAFELCEQYRAMFPDMIKRWDAQRQEKCTVEFVL
jgi:hypothetical protein